MTEEQITKSTGGRQSSGRGGRSEFVEFRDRIKRLVESMLALRKISPPDSAWSLLGSQERVDVNLESEAVIIEFFATELSWETASKIAHDFERSFARSAPIFLECRGTTNMRLRQSRQKDGSYGQLYLKENTILSFQKSFTGYSVKVETNLDDFNDHFEVFVIDAVRTLFPPAEKSHKKVADLESWREEFGRSFEKMGCRVLHESSLGWKDLVGLRNLRERLERSVLRPLVREQLYQKITSHVMPHRVNVLPRGVLLFGPPGCGKTWSMRVIAGEAGLPVIVFPCDAVLTKWYGESEARLASLFGLCREAGRMILLIDELDALARRRSQSHETTARLVSILLSEMDGLADSSGVLLVGSANNLESIDSAVLDRFDLKIEFALPDGDQLHAALSYYARQLSPEDVAEIVERLDGWNFRRIARFAEEVVRTYVSSLDLNLLEASDPPLPTKQDYLATLEGYQ